MINDVQYTCEASQNLLKNIEVMENANARQYFDSIHQNEAQKQPLQQYQNQSYQPQSQQRMYSNNNSQFNPN